MINLYICIASLIIGCLIFYKRYRIQFVEYRKEPWWIAMLQIVIFFIFGYFLGETIKYFNGDQTLFF